MVCINRSFFGTQGLSSTSANHVANMAKELVKGHLRDLEGIHFTETAVNALGYPNASILQKGADEETLAGVSDKLTDIGEANSLIAWLREGIKAKDAYLALIANATLDEYCELEGIDKDSIAPNIGSLDDFLLAHGFKGLPEEPSLKDPLTESDVVERWDTDTRVRYQQLKASCCAIERVITKFTDIMSEVKDSVSPFRFEDDDTSWLCYSTPTVSQEALETELKEFCAIRDKIEDELRDYRLRIQQQIVQENGAIEEAYNKELASYELELGRYNSLQAQYKVLHETYVAKKQQAETDLVAYRTNKSKEVGELKIVIPASLARIYEKVSALGK